MNLENVMTLEQIMMNFPRLDANKVLDLNTLDPTGKTFTQLVKIFLDEMQARISEMKNYVSSEQYDNLSKVVHRFRSTTYNLGAKRAAEITRRIDFVSVKVLVDKVELNGLVIALENECWLAYQQLLAQLPRSNAA